MSDLLKPRKNPCASCPYRKDVPSGIWDESEYTKLEEYDKETFEQPLGVFLCHQQDGCMCAGWIGVHDPEELLALRIAVGQVDWKAVEKFSTQVPLHASGTAAAEHGRKELRSPGKRAQEAIEKLLKKREMEAG